MKANLVKFLEWSWIDLSFNEFTLEDIPNHEMIKIFVNIENRL